MSKFKGVQSRFIVPTDKKPADFVYYLSPIMTADHFDVKLIPIDFTRFESNDRA